MLGQDSAEEQSIVRMQHSLARKAKEQPGHQFQRLYRVICRETWVAEALQRVLHNQGARTGGVDKITRHWFKENPERSRKFIDALSQDLRAGTYQPQPW